MTGTARTPGNRKMSRYLRRDGTMNVSTKGLTAVRFTDLYHSLLSVSWSVFIMLLILGYLFTNSVFAIAYALCGAGALEGVNAVDFVSRLSDCFFFSVQTLATIGYGKITPHGIIPNVLVTIEAFTGLLGLAMATGLLFSRFSRPTARVIFSKVAVVNKIDGVPSLVFRIANSRKNQIIEAEIKATLLMSEWTQEGVEYRNFYDLELERAHSPFFVLTWTIVHPLDQRSPLRQLSQERLRTAEFEILVSLIGIDDVFSQTVYAQFSYTDGDIVWGARFEDVLLMNGNREIQVDLNKIHSLVKDGVD